MMSRNLLDRLRLRAEARQWPPAPEVRLNLAGKLGEVSALRPSLETRRDPNKYPPAIIIGLGAAGEQVLRQWLEQLAHDPAGPQDSLRVILLTSEPRPALPEGSATVRQIHLSVSGNTKRPSCRRAEMHLLFRVFANYKPFEDYLSRCLTDLHSQVRVILIASLAEAIVGLLGDVLQTLRLTASEHSAGNPILSINALLTTQSPDPAQAVDDREVYAALREIGRFTFNGPHWMEPPPGQVYGVVPSSLLDNLFLIEPRSAALQPLDLQETTFEHGVGQALSEALLILLSPAAQTLWDHLGSQARPHIHEPLVYGLGIAALHIPLTEMQSYISARLGRAVLYGERRDRIGEGLLRYQTSAVSPASSSAALARRWLTSDRYAHPLFEWLLDAREASHFRAVPVLSGDFEAVFQAQLAHELASFLNDPTEYEHLAQAQAALRWLGKHFEAIKGWLPATPDSRAPSRMALRTLLQRWREYIASLVQQLDKWDQVLRPQTVAASAEASWHSAHSTFSGDWQEATQAFDVSVATISDFLREQLGSAEAALRAAGRGHIRRALTADAHEGIEEALRYYEDTVRPELSRNNLDNSDAFTLIRERIGWWIDIRPGQLPKLLLVLMPLHQGGTGREAPPREACFTPDQVEDIGRALLQLAGSQAQRVADDLTGRWLRDRLKQLADFLRRADAPLLTYDEDAASRTYAITRYSYLVARDSTVTGDYKGAIFPTVAPSQVNELVNQADPTRLTALSLHLNIPMDTLWITRHSYERYFHQGQVHLYPQEQLATQYEHRIHSLTGQWLVLPPELTLTLVDSQLVTIFCQSVFCGLVDVRADDLGQRSYWVVLPLADSPVSKESTRTFTASDTSEGFSPLQLAPADELGLFRAFRFFVLTEPTDRAVVYDEGRHFHRSQRNGFLNALHNAARERQRQPEYKNQRERFLHIHLAKWQQRSGRDVLARAFASLLEAELDEPLWKGW